MSRRARHAEMEFGSDSFLDVVANIVGILIILMVLAGIRARHAPVALADVSPPEEPVVEPRPVVAVPMKRVDPEAQEARRREVARWKSESETLEQEVQQLRQAGNLHELKLSDLQSQDAAQQNRVAAIKSDLQAGITQLQSDQKQTSELLAAAHAVRIRLKKRESDVIAAETQPHRVEKLQHRITPVSRVITENETEIHFRCLNGVVTAVPLDELVERLKAQMERQRDFILRTKKYNGSVGPVRGWSLNYVVETEQHLGLVRAGVSRFELIPEADLDGERADVALWPDSAFRNELRKADAASTITFWVYPDSFGLFRKLQSVAHREGFTVAARPLPEGASIMGSPHGSRSAGQ